mgnify:CR=1 FL=1
MGCRHVLVTGTHERTAQVVNTLHGGDGVMARDAWERSTWDDTRAAAEAFADWNRFLSSVTLDPQRDERPFYVRRYWKARERDSRAPSPRMPPR